MRAKRLALLLLTIGWLAPGCVTLDEYQRVEKERDNQKAILAAADKRVNKLKSEMAVARTRLRARETEVKELRERLRLARRAVEETKSELEAEYRAMIDELGRTGEFEVNAETGGIVLSGDILFAPGKTELREEGIALVRSLAEKLRSSEYAPYDVEVAGHTDSDQIQHSNWKDNWELATERARTVLLAMVEGGVTEERCFISGYGPHRPRAMDDKAMNRRVEVILRKREG